MAKNVSGSVGEPVARVGGQRIAMRTGTDLKFLLGDHLGSTSVTALASGAFDTETRYCPWGGVRWASGTTPTDYRFAGQQEIASIGLYFNNSRFYDAALGRFISPDSIIPNPGDPVSFDRFAYVRNNSLKYVDPSGNNPECGPDGIYCDNTIADEEKFGVAFIGTWSDEDKNAALLAIKATAQKFGAILGSNAGFAWALTFNYIELWMGGCDRCDPGDVGGYTYDAHQIRFSGLSDISELRRRNHVVHELGHAFKWLLHGEEGVDVYSELSSWRTGHPGFPDRETFMGTESETGPNYGFASRQNIFTWQQSLNGDDSEEFADQFLGWIFNRWETATSGYLSLDGQARADMMSSNMPSWVSLFAQP